MKWWWSRSEVILLLPNDDFLDVPSLRSIPPEEFLQVPVISSGVFLVISLNFGDRRR